MSETNSAVENDEPVLPAAPDGAPSGRRIAPFVAGVVAVVLIGFLWVLIGADPPADDTAETPLLGKPAPEMVSVTLDGEPFDLSRRRGSWVVLNFFNSTCVPCIREHPELVRFDQQQEAQGIDGAELYTVVFDDTEGPVREFFEKEGGDWPIVTDPNGTIATSLGMSQVPETWIISDTGIVTARFIGEITADGLTTTLADLRRQSGGG